VGLQPSRGFVQQHNMGPTMMIQSKQFQRLLGATLVLLSLLACKSFGGGGSSVPPGIQPNSPKVVSCTPPSGSTGIPLNEVASVTFSEAMDIATLNSSTFLLTYGAAATPVQGEVVCTNARAVFWPTAHFASNSLFTVTITTGAKSATGVPLVTNHTWTFTTGSPASVQLSGRSQSPGMNLIGGTRARPLAVLAGNHGSQAGFLALEVSQAFSTPALITEWVYQADSAPPMANRPLLIRGDLQPAFAQAAFRRVSLRPVLRSDNTTGQPEPFVPSQ
jgi:hypothetical protein